MSVSSSSPFTGKFDRCCMCMFMCQPFRCHQLQWPRSHRLKNQQYGSKLSTATAATKNNSYSRIRRPQCRLIAVLVCMCVCMPVYKRGVEAACTASFAPLNVHTVAPALIFLYVYIAPLFSFGAQCTTK